MDIFAQLASLLQRGDWPEDLLVGMTAQIDLRFGLLFHAHNAELHVANMQEFAYGIASFGEQFVVHLVAYDTYFSLLLYINLVDLASVEQWDI